MRNIKKRYFQFPLFLMQGLIDNPDAVLQKILLYGLKKYASNLNYSDEQIATHVIYDYYHKQTSEAINAAIENYIDVDLISADPDYKGFNRYGNFSAEENVAELLGIFETHEDFYFMCKEFLQIGNAIKDLQRNIDNEYLHRLHMNYNPDTWEKVRDVIVPANEPMPNVEAGLLLKQISRKKTDSELVQFTAFLAVNSVFGKKGYTQFPSNKEHVVARMFGYKSHKDVPDKKHPLHEKYLTRYHFENLMYELTENWHINYYSTVGIRGFYLAKDRVQSINDLAILAEGSKKKNRMLQRKKNNKQAAANAREQIKKQLDSI